MGATGRCGSSASTRQTANVPLYSFACGPRAQEGSEKEEAPGMRKQPSPLTPPSTPRCASAVLGRLHDQWDWLGGGCRCCGAGELHTYIDSRLRRERKGGSLSWCYLAMVHGPGQARPYTARVNIGTRAKKNQPYKVAKFYRSVTEQIRSLAKEALA